MCGVIKNGVPKIFDLSRSLLGRRGIAPSRVNSMSARPRGTLIQSEFQAQRRKETHSSPGRGEALQGTLD